MSDRSFTPRELHLKAISVADQVERLAASSGNGSAARALEIEVVVAAAADLRRRVEETAADPAHGGRDALVELDGARSQVVRALELVLQLTGRVPVAPRFGPVVVADPRAPRD